MTLYATASELASIVQQDVDTATATLVLQTASAMFSRAADTWWTATSVTYQVVGGGRSRLDLPFRPVTAVSQVRMNAVVLTGWTLVKNALYYTGGFGAWGSFPPDLVEVDLTHGYTSVPDDVKAAVLETAAQAYVVPVGAVISETIDDYAVRYANASGGVQLTPFARDLAALYRGTLAA